MKLQDLCELIVDCEHKTAPTQATGYPSIRTPNIGRGYFILDDVNRVSEETYRLWTRRAVPQPGDLIMAREAPVGNVAKIPPQLQPCLGQRTLLIRPDCSKVDPSFLNYFLNGPHVQGLIQGKTNGATVAHLNMEDVRTMELPELPPLPTQRRTGEILSAYDDLIENNTRRIKILEQMAQMIYREWFVNFRFPDRANNRLRESEIGNVPNGWDVVSISNLYKTGSGGTPSRKVAQYFGGSVPWVKTKELLDGFVIDSEEKITESGMENSSAKLFPAGTVLMAMYGATIGQLGILSKEASCNQACCAMTPHVQPFGTEYLFLTLKHKRSDIIGLRMGAAQQNISQEVIRRIPILKPKSELLVRFNRLAVPVFGQIRVLTQKNTALHTTRDLLLPKLVSGEVSVEQIESEVPVQTI